MEDAPGLGPWQSIGDSTNDARTIVAETRVEMLRGEVADLRARLAAVRAALKLIQEHEAAPAESLRRIVKERTRYALALTSADAGAKWAELRKAAKAIVWDSDDEEGLHYCAKAEAHRLMSALAALEGGG